MAVEGIVRGMLSSKFGEENMRDNLDKGGRRG
jgi:hypothetical protein